MTGLGKTHKTLAPAHENLELEFGLKLLDLFAHARLRGVKLLRNLRQVEVVLDCGPHIFQLLQVHGALDPIWDVEAPGPGWTWSGAIVRPATAIW